MIIVPLKVWKSSNIWVKPQQIKILFRKTLRVDRRQAMLAVIQCRIFSLPVCYPKILKINPFMPKDPYNGHTSPLTSKRCILYTYSTNTCTEYFKHGIYSPFFSLQNAVCFIILTYLVPVLFTFYIQGVLKFKEIIPAPKG